VDTAEPAAFDPSLPALQLAHRALRRACDTDVAVVRSGGTLPILSALAERRIPTVVSGFALAADQIHAPNESYRLEALELGRRAARELYAELAGLDTEAPHA
jgi:acetylornithine deacetylase/succinyl-diaminopimelate desuccinylase-like protein